MSYMHHQLPKQADIAGIAAEFFDKGQGPTLLYLHPVDGVHPELPFVQQLQKSFRVVGASHPGFGATPLPPGLSSVDDLAYFYLDLLETMNLRDVVLVGSSFGGWIAAEIATKSCERLRQLVLVDSLGVKYGDRETRSVADYFQVAIPDLPEFLFHDPTRGREAFNNLDFAGMRDDEIRAFTRNRESYALFNWNPSGYNPKLKGRLHRVKVPTLVLWGENDQVVSPAYGRALAEAIPGARFEVIRDCGHYPHVEQPEAFVSAIKAFSA